MALYRFNVNINNILYDLYSEIIIIIQKQLQYTIKLNYIFKIIIDK